MIRVAFVLGLGLASFGTPSAEAGIEAEQDTVGFTSRIPASSLQKRVSLRAEDLKHSPFGNYLRYDSTRIKVFSWEEPLIPPDSISDSELGMLSTRWAVKEGAFARYLNLSDLKRLGLKDIGPKEISDWMIFGRTVGSASEFRNMADELKKAGIIEKSLPAGFVPAETSEIGGYRYFSMTFFRPPYFTKFHYLVSKDGAVMLRNREDFFRVRFPEMVPIPVMPGAFMLKNPADSLLEKKSEKYLEIMYRHLEQLLH